MLVGCLWQNDHIITVSLGGSIYLYSSNDLDKAPLELCGHMKNINSLILLKGNPRYILSTSYDGLIIKWLQGVGYSGKLERKDSTQIKCFAAVEGEIVTSGFDNKVSKYSISFNYDLAIAHNSFMYSQSSLLHESHANIPFSFLM